MLKCKEVVHQASDFVDSDRPWYRKLSWHMHLFICHKCRRFIRQLKLSIRTGRQFPPPPPSEEKVDKIVAHILTNKKD